MVLQNPENGAFWHFFDATLAEVLLSVHHHHLTNAVSKLKITEIRPKYAYTKPNFFLFLKYSNKKDTDIKSPAKMQFYRHFHSTKSITQNRLPAKILYLGFYWSYNEVWYTKMFAIRRTVYLCALQTPWNIRKCWFWWKSDFENTFRNEAVLCGACDVALLMLCPWFFSHLKENLTSFCVVYSVLPKISKLLVFWQRLGLNVAVFVNIF